MHYYLHYSESRFKYYSNKNIKIRFLSLMDLKKAVIFFFIFCRKMQYVFSLYLFIEEVFNYFGDLDHNLNLFYDTIEDAIMMDW